ncbi:MAG: nucleotidyl transferase AbiEii/AbiGii toxin family protein [Bacteroidales bacterium]|nr:nucleotidyl transferase AbiEii/AbiGii toxin family protein [Bacteroidales bacterium]
MAAIFDQMLARYNVKIKTQEINALHEVMQQITLAALYRADFFSNAAFCGGTCLRIFHKSPRFSEDMDFTLLEPDENFSLEKYFDTIYEEFQSHGRKIQISLKSKQQQSTVESAFLKDTTDIANLAFQTEPTVRIKIEVDTNPPSGFETENKLLLLPYSFTTRCIDLKGLFAGKIHAFLFRNWKRRVKGRDWYDFEWYIRNDQPVDFNHLRERSLQTGYSGDAPFTEEIVRKLLREKISSTPISRVLDNVRPFIDEDQSLEIWSEEYFLQLVDMMRFV